MGPVDGHNLTEIIQCLEYAKEEKRPVFIHVHTKKGKGYAPAESNPQKFHGISPFDKATGETKKGSETYSARFGNTLVRLAKNNKKIVAITGAMPNGTGLDEFQEQYKDRFLMSVLPNSTVLRFQQDWQRSDTLLLYRCIHHSCNVHTTKLCTTSVCKNFTLYSLSTVPV